MSTEPETIPEWDTIAGVCARLQRDRRQVVAYTKRLTELVWQDRRIHTGPARRAEIRALLESNLDTEAMVEVLDALLHRYVTEMSRRLITPLNEPPDLSTAGGGEVHVDGKLVSAAAVAYVESLGVDITKITPEGIAFLNAVPGVVVGEGDPAGAVGTGAEEVGAVDKLNSDSGHGDELEAFAKEHGYGTAAEMAEALKPWTPSKEEWTNQLKRVLLEVAAMVIKPLTTAGRAQA